MIIKCDCKHEYQDKVYGPQMRVHTKRTDKNGGWTCTVCRKGNKPSPK